MELGLKWQNTGKTPTKDLVTHINIRYEETDLPDGFRFPDTWIIGLKQINPPISIPPDGSSASVISQFSVEQLQAIRNRQKTLYVYGWADYNDIFTPRTPRRRTEFCVQVHLPGDHTFASVNNIAFDIYWKHNGADDECMRIPTTSVKREKIPHLPRKPPPVSQS
jgi:hypothetical protein